MTIKRAFDKLTHSLDYMEHPRIGATINIHQLGQLHSNTINGKGHSADTILHIILGDCEALHKRWLRPGSTNIVKVREKWVWAVARAMIHACIIKASPPLPLDFSNSNSHGLRGEGPMQT
ncbi:unnamed protein product [Dovyalis caffra]|uniref:Uncharacterized protein n=1 Tax=Dovyalis caffra TaxID=77055 RepID=A0AAV1SC61_9ROSI|nr:unnamed protein product [Dovyalis caffra]